MICVHPTYYHNPFSWLFYCPSATRILLFLWATGGLVSLNCKPRLHLISILASTSETCCLWTFSLLRILCAINLYCTLSASSWPSHMANKAPLFGQDRVFSQGKSPDTHWSLVLFTGLYWLLLLPRESSFLLSCFDLPGFCCWCILWGPFRSSAHFLSPTQQPWFLSVKQAIGLLHCICNRTVVLPKLTPNGSLLICDLRLPNKEQFLLCCCWWKALTL